MADNIEIHGQLDPRFARVKDAFAANFATTSNDDIYGTVTYL